MDTAGVGGQLTGKGADLLIIDDPIKSPAEANSKVVRDSQWEWYQGAVYSRLEPGAGMVLVQTRWHQDDLAGRILEEEGEDWVHINLPAISEGADVLGRVEGEALWPDRYDEKALEQIQRRVGPYYWSALYQQRPSPKEGATFQGSWARFFVAQDGAVELRKPEGNTVYLSHLLRRFATVDSAASLKARADYTVIAVWDVTPQNDLLLRDLYRKRIEAPQLVELMKVINERWHPGFFGFESSTVGLPVIQLGKQHGLPIKEIPPHGDKYSRAIPAATRMQGGGIYFPVGASFNKDVFDELQAFPTGAHDDIVDALSMAVNDMMVSAGPLPKTEELSWAASIFDYGLLNRRL